MTLPLSSLSSKRPTREECEAYAAVLATWKPAASTTTETGMAAHPAAAVNACACARACVDAQMGRGAVVRTLTVQNSTAPAARAAEAASAVATGGSRITARELVRGLNGPEYTPRLEVCAQSHTESALWGTRTLPPAEFERIGPELRSDDPSARLRAAGAVGRCLHRVLVLLRTWILQDARALDVALESLRGAGSDATDGPRKRARMADDSGNAASARSAAVLSAEFAASLAGLNDSAGGKAGIDAHGIGAGPSRVPCRVTGEYRYLISHRGVPGQGAATPAGALTPLVGYASPQDEYQPDLTAWRAVKEQLYPGITLETFRSAILQQVDWPPALATADAAPFRLLGAAADGSLLLKRDEELRVASPPIADDPVPTPADFPTRTLRSPTQIIVVDADILARVATVPSSDASTGVNESLFVSCGLPDPATNCHEHGRTPPVRWLHDAAWRRRAVQWLQRLEDPTAEEIAPRRFRALVDGLEALRGPWHAGYAWLTESQLASSIASVVGISLSDVHIDASIAPPLPVRVDEGVAGILGQLVGAVGADTLQDRLAAATAAGGDAAKTMLPEDDPAARTLWGDDAKFSAAMSALPPALALSEAMASALGHPRGAPAEPIRLARSRMGHDAAVVPWPTLCPEAPLLWNAHSFLHSDESCASGFPSPAWMAWSPHIFPRRHGHALAISYHGTGADMVSFTIEEGYRRPVCRMQPLCIASHCECQMEGFGVYTAEAHKANQYATRRSVLDKERQAFVGARVAALIDFGLMKAAPAAACKCGCGRRFVDHWGTWHTDDGSDSMYVRDGSKGATDYREWAIADPRRCTLLLVREVLNRSVGLG